jgi:hypothetical protein
LSVFRKQRHTTSNLGLFNFLISVLQREREREREREKQAERQKKEGQTKKKNKTGATISNI